MDKQKNGIIAIIVFVIFINFFLYHAFGTFAVTLILFALHSLILKLSRRTPVVRIVFCVGIVSAVAVSMRGSAFVGVISTVCSLGLLMVLVYLAASGGKFFQSFSEMLLMPLSLIAPYMSGLVKGIKTLIGHGGKVKSWAAGLVIGVPLILFLIQHFIRADAIFAYTVRKFLDQALFQRVLTHGFVSFVVFFCLLPVAFIALRKRISAREFISQFSFVREATVIVGLVASVVGAFLVIQFPYIFVRVAAETDLARFGVATYSEYVKQGFGEFLFIACILYAVAWFGLLGRSVRWVQGILIIEIGVYIISLFRRVWLYQAFHGLTLGRLYGGLFLVWVTFLFMTLGGRHLWPKVRWVVIESIGTAILLLVFTFGNAEYLIASWRPPTVNHHTDYIYLSRLSSDGYIGWQKAFAYTRETLTDPSFNQKKVLDKEDRQVIDYAGIVLMQLARRMHWYVRVYGTEEEKNSYMSAVLAFHKDMLASSIPEISRRAKEERAGGVAYGQFGAIEKQVNDELKWISGNPDNTLERTTLGYASLEYSMPMDPPVSFYNIVVDQNYKARSFDALDTLYVWNWSDRKAYARMSMDMPTNELLSLQRLYVQFAARIAKQPSTEQGYSRDVSFDGPFLSPL